MAQFFNRFRFRQTIFFVYVLVTITLAESLLSHDEECLVLYQFKQNILHQGYPSFNSHAFQKFDSWKISNNSSVNDSVCCLWDGVECSGKGKDVQVTGLDLSESFLHVPINSSNVLFNLVHLRRLNLATNDFDESQIPYEIGRLKQLRSLNLSNSRFSGQIPNEISKLTKLSLLDLSQNSLSLRSPILENLVRNLTVLEELDFSGVDIGSSVPHLFSNYSSLSSISLQNCGLQNEFPMAILHLPKLKNVNLAGNPSLTGSLPEFRNNSLLEILVLTLTGFSGVIPESISNLNHLTVLDLQASYFSGHIPGSLANMSQLTNIHLGQNELTGPVPSLVSLSELSVLNLLNNRLEIGCLPDWLGKLINLKEVYADNSNITGEIPPFLANLTKLTHITMRSNSLFGRIPSSFMNLTQLRVIDLAHNRLQGPISRSFSNFKSLRTLGLFNNLFSGRVDLDMFTGLNKLEGLSLGGNQISVVASNNCTNGTLPEFKYLILSQCNLKEFPAFLRFQHKLITLNLVNNEIYGLIPVWIWNNSRETMQTFIVGYNYVTGFHQHPYSLPWVRLEIFLMPGNELQGWMPIPPQTTLVYDVSENHLTGNISPLICEVKSLQVLDLSINNMTGTLPTCLGNFSNSLMVLDLKQNNFYGPVVDTFMNGSLLKAIDLSENHFTGLVPKSFSNCTSLVVLSLGDNSFEDVFPLWLGTLPELQVLILRSNKLYGEIHGLFLKLRIIDLSNNGFSGQLPDKFFQTLSAMKSDYGNSFAMGFRIPIEAVMPFEFVYSMTLTNKGVKREYERILNILTAIDFSGNNFEGQIPQSLQDLQGLQSLNLSNNHFTGRVLTSLGNLKNLESLDLSHNELSGEIPQQLLQLGFLAIFNASFNHLDGRIPQGKQFNTFENNSYLGNSGLCGKPLSSDCQNSKAPALPTISIDQSESSLLPSDITDWIVVFTGFISGLVIGMVAGKIIYARYSDLFIELFGLRKNRWVRPLALKNTRRN